MPTRWIGTTPEERRAAMRHACDERSGQAREAKITELISKAPPLTDAQKARLRLLLNPSDAGQEAAL
jgi:hypothetical protein